jgi:hypothetical protein
VIAMMSADVVSDKGSCETQRVKEEEFRLAGKLNKDCDQERLYAASKRHCHGIHTSIFITQPPGYPGPSSISLYILSTVEFHNASA